MLRPERTRGIALLGAAMLLAVMAGCDAARLEDTHWLLTTLGDTELLVGQIGPWIRLDGKERRVNGSGGCNSLTGSYELDADRLTFGAIASTRMACPQGMDTEQALHEAMGRVSGWRIAGQHLELLDAAGVRVARFEVWHPK